VASLEKKKNLETGLRLVPVSRKRLKGYKFLATFWGGKGFGSLREPGMNAACKLSKLSMGDKSNLLKYKVAA